MIIFINDREYNLKIKGANGKNWYKSIKCTVESLGYNWKKSSVFIPHYVAGNAKNEKNRYMSKNDGYTQLLGGN